MDNTKYMLIAKGKIITDTVAKCEINYDTNKYDITFTNGKKFSYLPQNILFMSNPKVLDPNEYIVATKEGRGIFGIKWIYEFARNNDVYWHISCENTHYDYSKNELIINKNCLSNKQSTEVFQYLKDISDLSEIKNDSNENVLRKHYDKISFISESTALSKILNTKAKINNYKINNIIFPFGCNQSQYKAVWAALENQISVIQGPPGTGKTQTILNIIANILINNKSVIIVSNNNSATLNVLEKLSKEKYGMDFLVASLGNSDNKKAFVESQAGIYPHLASWVTLGSNDKLLSEINELSAELQKVYKLREDIARLKDEKYKIELESRHFYEYSKDNKIDSSKYIDWNMSADKIMQLWQELQNIADQDKKVSFWTKLKSSLFYGMKNWKLYKNDISEIITILQDKYYEQSIFEIKSELERKEQELNSCKGDNEKQLEEKSLNYFKFKIASRYNWKGNRQKFTLEDLYKNPRDVIREYPIILSTTFSARSSLNAQECEFDYVIMDEASQVDLATGALALSCARNAVIVGDLKQLPNVVDNNTKQKADVIWQKYDINSAYNYAENSFLKSVVELIPDVPQTLLKEHYRCHPRIISFCNQMFYNNELSIMTEDDNSRNTLMAIKTAEGNHERNKYNQRQIDIIKNEILPTIDISLEEIGIITPYNAQVDEIKRQIPNIDVATVHKYQGREKELIILSTVDDQIGDFTDDPYLLNVAVSRAKKRLIVIISGNKQLKQGNISDLISYIQYNKMEVVDSKIYSVFDYLYLQYTKQRWEYLKKHKMISQYDSENLTYALIIDILKDYQTYGVACFIRLSMVVKDLTPFSDDEIKYILNPGTHIDFLIYNKLGNQPILAIETDGYSYHKNGTVQAERDIKKNHILEIAGLKLLRLSTNGSMEKEKIIAEIEQYTN